MSTSTHDDRLLRYCVALDANDFATVKRILKEAETNEALETSIVTLHNRFNAMKSFTEQLQHTRGEVVHGQ